MKEELEKQLEKIKRKAKHALSKKAAYGPDIDLTLYIKSRGEAVKLEDYEEKLMNVGIELSSKSRAASYFQVDNIALNTYSSTDEIELTSLSTAIRENEDLILNYYWKAVPVDLDKYTAIAELAGGEGYVIVAHKDARIKRPIQTCLLLHKPKLIQAPHNIIVAEENSEIHIVTGCLTSLGAEGLHAGVTEIYVKKNATVTYTMIHNWSRKIHVRPRTAAIVENGGKLILHYINMSPIASLQSYPKIELIGAESKAYTSSILIGRESSLLDLGSCIILSGERTSGEVVSRIIATDSSKVISRAKLVGEARNVKGHIECSGLLLTNKAKITTIPELEAKVSELQLTHEAAVGRISEEEVIYLMARGFTRREAESMIVRGFMEVSIKDLPNSLIKRIQKVLDLVAEKL